MALFYHVLPTLQLLSPVQIEYICEDYSSANDQNIF